MSLIKPSVMRRVKNPKLSETLRFFPPHSKRWKPPSDNIPLIMTWGFVWAASYISQQTLCSVSQTMKITTSNKSYKKQNFWSEQPKMFFCWVDFSFSNVLTTHKTHEDVTLYLMHQTTSWPANDNKASVVSNRNVSVEAFAAVGLSFFFFLGFIGACLMSAPPTAPFIR